MTMPERPPLPLLKRVFADMMNSMLYLMEGYRAPFGRELYRTYTFGQVMEWNRRVMKVIKTMEKELGPWQGQLCIALSAVWNGCEFCAQGHTYASNLLYFKATGKLLPVDENEMPRLQRMKDSALMDELRKRFGADEFKQLLARIERMYALHEGAQPTQSGDEVLHAVNATWQWVNECSIISPTTPVPPLNAIGKQAKVVEAYHQLRGRPVPPHE